MTLTHVTRPLLLARSLSPAEYEIFFACDPRFDQLLEPLPSNRFFLHSISTEQFLRANYWGFSFFGIPTLHRYIKDDLKIIAEVSPDVVVGDMRQSLSISCKQAGVPLINLVNAYYSPYAHQPYELGEHPLVHVVSDKIMDPIFPVIAPFSFACHTLPLNITRLWYGQGLAGFKLHHEFIYGDYNLYCDIPDLVPTEPLPAHHQFIGPLLWSPDMVKPPWWNQMPTDKPIIYVGLGSSGASQILPIAMAALADMPVYAIVATAAADAPVDWPKNVFAAPYLPGADACERADVVVCNGGSTSGQQSLAAGTPFLGVASNIDQVMFSRLAARQGAGLLLKEHHVNVSTMREAIATLLSGSTYQTAAKRMQEAIRVWKPEAHFRRLITSILNGAGGIVHDSSDAI